MSTHLILGAGPIGRATAHSLIAANHEVKIGTRSHTPAPHCTTLTLDATDTPAVTQAATDCESLIICINPPYHRWPTDWPPAITACITAARTTGARIVLMGNLYPFGRPTGTPFTNATPENPTEAKGTTRAALWHMLTQAEQEYGISVSELRASDYITPEPDNNSHAGDRFLNPLKAGKTAWVVGDPTVQHAWSYVPDIGECLARLATTPELSGQYWVGPIAGHASLNELATAITPQAKVRQIPAPALRLLGLVDPMVREINSVKYQHTEPYLVDDSELKHAFDFAPTPLPDVIAVVR
ncbi:MAG: NAD-dependent epimerase/dehydratase family protein [Corynebacterium sp.]|nr:NAD-dependent epimerase/dehydratase family protein [Corynebacterium sp.]